MNPNLRNSVDEVSNMAEELGLSTLLGLTSPEGKSPSKSSSPQKVTKEVIYKKFEKQWDKANHGVLKDRYESKPHKPPVLDKRDLARLADPIRGKYRSQKEYIERVTGGDPDELAELETSGAFITDIDLGGNENRPQNNMMSSVDMSRGGGGGTFLTENMDGSVSPVKQRGNRNNNNPADTTRRSVQYNRSGGNLNNQQQQQANRGVGGRNGAVSRLRGKLEDASRMDYKRGTGRGGLQNSVLSGRAGATNNNNNNNNNNSANARGRGGAVGTAGPSRFGGGSTSVRSVRSSGYGLPVQNKTTGGIGRAGARGSTSKGNTRPSMNRSMNRSMNNGNGNGSSSRGSSVRPRRGGRDEEDLDKSKDQGQPRGRVYARPGVPRLSKQPSSSSGMRSKSRGRSANTTAADDDDKKNTSSTTSTGPLRGGRTSRGSSRTRNGATSREPLANRRAGAGAGGLANSRTGSAGGGLAAVRERRTGFNNRANNRGSDKDKDVSKADIGFRRLGASQSSSTRERADAAKKRREEAAARRGASDSSSRSRRGQHDNNSSSNSNRGNSLPRTTRNSESAPTLTRPGAEPKAAQKAGVPATAADGGSSTASGSRSRTAGTASKARGGTDPLVPGSASAAATASKVPVKDTSEVLKVLADVQESEQKRQAATASGESAANNQAIPATAAAPRAALARGPGGNVASTSKRGGGVGVASGKDSGNSSKGASSVSDSSDGASMAALLAAKANKLQGHFAKADSLRSSFQALDEAESLALNESYGLGLDAQEGGGGGGGEEEVVKPLSNVLAAGAPKRKSPTKLKAAKDPARDMATLQKSMDEEKLRSMIESDRGGGLADL